MSAIWFQESDLDELPAVETEAELPVGRLTRLDEAVLPGSGPINARLAVDRRDDGVVLLTGSISGSLQIACQRCLEPMAVRVDDDLRLALLATEQESETVPSGYEVLIVPRRKLRLADLIEDDVLLDLPLAARHAEGQCGRLIDSLEALEQQSPETTTPFAGLADMMRGRQ